MNGNLFFNAIFRFRNFATLIGWFLVVYLMSGSLEGLNLNIGTDIDTLITAAYGLGGVTYLGMVIQSLFSNNYREEVNIKEKKKELNNLNRQCARIAAQARGSITPIQRQKLRKIMQDKDDILNSLKRGDERNYLKEKIVEKSLNLVISYIKLMTNYSIRIKELSELNTKDIINKINVNRRKLSFLKDERMVEDIRSIIEMDENTIQRVKDEKNDLERISAR